MCTRWAWNHRNSQKYHHMCTAVWGVPFLLIFVRCSLLWSKVGESFCSNIICSGFEQFNCSIATENCNKFVIITNVMFIQIFKTNWIKIYLYYDKYAKFRKFALLYVIFTRSMNWYWTCVTETFGRFANTFTAIVFNILTINCCTVFRCALIFL